MKKELQLDSDAHEGCLQSDNDSLNVKYDNREHQEPVAHVDVHSDSKVTLVIHLIMSCCFPFSLLVSIAALCVINTVRYLITQKLSPCTFKAFYLLLHPVNVDYGLSSKSEDAREI